MQNRKDHRLFSLVLVLLLTCVVALSVTFFSTTTTNAATLSRRPKPTPTVVPTTAPTQGVTPTATTGGGTSCQVTYTIFNQFFSGFTAELNITNTGSTTINGWTLQFAFPDGQVIQSSFNGGFTQTGPNVTVVNRSYNGTIAPGGSVVAPPGFVASWNNIVNDPPASFTLNGVLCSKG